MENNNESINVTMDQMKHLASERLGEIRKSIDGFNRKNGLPLSPTECDDIELETYMRACDRACTYDPAKGTLTAWLKRIAHNLACDRLNEKNQQVRLDESYCDGDADEAIRRGLDRLTRSERDQLTVRGLSGCEEALAFEDRRKLLLQRECWQEAFNALSDRDQLLLYMRWDLKLRNEEIAQQLHMEHIAVRVAYSRAVRQFEAELEARHYHDIDEWTSRYFHEDCPLDWEDDDETFFGGRSEANG